MKNRVLLAFSGGADSRRAARVLMDEGYEVAGLYIDMLGDGEMVAAAVAAGRGEGIGVEVCDARELFAREVVDYFVAEYAAGRAPTPCTVCNDRIKWRLLLREADRGGFGRIATGHYFRIARRDGLLHVSAADDRRKDQSWYLWQLDQDVLERALTPMGTIMKSDVLAAMPPDKGYRESMGVCFLGGRPCGDFLRDRLGCTPGETVDREGRIIGRHDGYALYTPGQKKGLALPGGMCVVGVDPAANRVTAGYSDDLWHGNLVLGGWRAANPGRLFSSDRIAVRIRGIGLNPAGFCRIMPCGDTLRVALDTPAWAPAKGQAAVFYEDDMVVGGGFVEDFY